MCLRYSKTNKRLFQAIKRRSPKSRKIDIFTKGLTHGFGQKMTIFPTFLFLAIQARKMSLMIFSNEKTSFQAIKTRSPKSRKIDIFPDGLTHGFGPKMAIFPTFFFQAIQARKMCLNIFQNEKTPFLAYKNKKSLKSKNSHFSQGVNPWFGSKKGHFSNFVFFRQYRPGKCLL